MTGWTDDQATQLCDVARRLAFDMRRNRPQVAEVLSRLDRARLEGLVCVLAAMVPPSRVDAWWQDDATPEAVFARRRAVLLGEDAA